MDGSIQIVKEQKSKRSGTPTISIDALGRHGIRLRLPYYNVSMSGAKNWWS